MDAVQNLQASIAELDAYIQPLLHVKLDQLAGHRTPVERAKLASCLAYAVYSLYYSYVRTQGVEPSDHAVKNELLRVRDYMKKVKDVTAALESANGNQGDSARSTDQEDRDPGQPKVDIAASARVIKASISKDSSSGSKGKKRAASRDAAKGSRSSSKAGSKRDGGAKAKKNRKK